MLEEEASTASLALKVQLIFLVILVAGVAIIAGFVIRKRNQEKKEKKYIERHQGKIPNRSISDSNTSVLGGTPINNPQIPLPGYIPEDNSPKIPPRVIGIDDTIRPVY